MYGVEGHGISSPLYGCLVNNRHYYRIKNLLENALKNGADLVTGGKTDDTKNYIAPTVLKNVSPEHAIMKEEIFGPVLPVISYKTLDDAIDCVNRRERPL